MTNGQCSRSKRDREGKARPGDTISGERADRGGNLDPGYLAAVVAAPARLLAATWLAIHG